MKTPEAVGRFLALPCVAVVGVSSTASKPGSLIYARLKQAGTRVYAVNPARESIRGEACYPDLAALPEKPAGVVIATAPAVTRQVVRQCGELGIRHVWMHRSFGQGSHDPEAAEYCRNHSIELLEAGCPMMYVEPVDLAHKCMRGILGLFGRLP